MLQSPQIVSINVGIDWLTMTLPKEATLAQKWLNDALVLVDGVVSDGNELQYRDRLGYSGVATNHCFVGESADRIMVTFQSHYAHSAANVLYRGDCNVSRLDVRVDCQYDRMPANIGKKAYRDAIAHNNTLNGTRKRKIHIIVGSDNGDTVYTGSAASEQRGCLYNKSVESGDSLYEHTWRYEVRLKDRQAYAIYTQYAKGNAYGVNFLSDFVAIWYESRGIDAPWPYDATNLPMPPKAELPSDAERKLKWLQRQVRPTIEYLLSVTDCDTILKALGLPNEYNIMSSEAESGVQKAVGDTLPPEE